MVIKALDLSKQKRHICKGDDPANPTIFILGTLSSRDKGAIRDSMTSFSLSDEGLDNARARSEGKEGGGSASMDTKIERSKMAFEAVRRGLKGWENFMGADDTPVPFKLVLRDVGGGVQKSVVPTELMDIMPLVVIEELSGVIMGELSENEGEDGKNSQEPSLGGSSTPTDDAPPAP